jgi:hypothetical protein
LQIKLEDTADTVEEEVKDEERIEDAHTMTEW